MADRVSQTTAVASIKASLDEPCAACPVEVRNLYATADNAMRAFEAALRGDGSAERAIRKLGELKEAIEVMKPIVEKHFEDPKHAGIFAHGH